MALVSQTRSQFAVSVLNLGRVALEFVTFDFSNITSEGRQQDGCSLNGDVNEALVGEDVVIEGFGTAKLILDGLRLGTERLIYDLGSFWFHFLQPRFDLSQSVLVIFLFAANVSHLFR